MRNVRTDQWQKIRAVLEHCPKVYLGTEVHRRRFIDAVLGINRTGAPWRDPPPPDGNGKSISQRFARWWNQGIWGPMLAPFADAPEMEHLILDSTVVRAHPWAAGAAPQTGGQADPALGRRRGGFSSPIPVRVDGVGTPLPLILPPGQAGDRPHAAALLAEMTAEGVSAHRADDPNAIRPQIAELGADAIIPPHPNRKEPAEDDRYRYKERHRGEWFITKIKHVRRVFARFEKLAGRYMGFWQFTRVLMWLRYMSKINRT